MADLNTTVQTWLDEQTEEDYPSAGQDLLEHGCQSGVVSDLIYYTDTVAFYDKHQEEIDEMLAEACEDCGCRPDQLFGDNWDSDDPLARGDLNKNLLAWFGFEETTRRIIEA